MTDAAQHVASHTESTQMFTLEEVVPWGRSFDEYRRMFALSDDDLTLRILGCGDGPASFNAEATRRGAAVISCDPIYRWEVADIRERIAATYDEILDQTRRNIDEFLWDSIQSVDELGEVRMAAMQDFLNDYGQGRAQGRYVSRPSCRRFRSPPRHLTSRCARTSCFCTAFSSVKRFIRAPFESCAGLREKFGSFLC